MDTATTASVARKLATDSTADKRPPPGRDKRPSKRRFPGPAGLLPTLRHNEFAQLVDTTKQGHKNPITEKINSIISSDGRGVTVEPVPSQVLRTFLSQPIGSCSQSQSDNSLFEESTWQTLLAELGCLSSSDDENNPNSLMSLMNINWITKRAVKLQLPACIKIPLLVVILQETNGFATGKSGFNKAGNPNVVLVDTTGTIQAALDPSFCAAYGNYLKPGTALALQNVGVHQHKRDATLIITELNVICMTSKENIDDPDGRRCLPDQSGAHPTRAFVTEDNVRVTHFCDFKTDEILKELNFINLPNEDEDDEDDQEGENPAACQSVSIFESATTAADSSSSRSNLERTGNQRNKFSFHWKTDLSQSFDKMNRIPPPPFIPPLVPHLFNPRQISPVLTSSSSPNTTTDTFEEDEDDDDEIFRLIQTEEVAKSDEAHKPSSFPPIFVAASQIFAQSNFQISGFDAEESSPKGDMPCDSDEELLHCDESYTEELLPPTPSYSPKTPPEDSQGEMPVENDDEVFLLCSQIEAVASSGETGSLLAKDQPNGPSQLSILPPPPDPNSHDTFRTIGQQEDISCSEDDEDEFFNLL